MFQCVDAPLKIYALFVSVLNMTYHILGKQQTTRLRLSFQIRSSKSTPFKYSVSN
jgi:hypothetical protein